MQEISFVEILHEPTYMCIYLVFFSHQIFKVSLVLPGIFLYMLNLSESWASSILYDL